MAEWTVRLMRTPTDPSRASVVRLPASAGFFFKSSWIWLPLSGRRCRRHRDRQRLASCHSGEPSTFRPVTATGKAPRHS